jgi:heterodisulfide reductase subunit C
MKLSGKLLKEEWVRKIEELSEQPISSCYQCGKCSAGCPIVEAMDLLPNQVIRLVVLAQKDVLSARTPWLCASCMVCESRCPVGIDLSRVMEAIRTISLRSGIDFVLPDRIPPGLIERLPQQAFVSNFRKFTS